MRLVNCRNEVDMILFPVHSPPSQRGNRLGCGCRLLLEDYLDEEDGRGNKRNKVLSRVVGGGREVEVVVVVDVMEMKFHASSLNLSRSHPGQETWLVTNHTRGTLALICEGEDSELEIKTTIKMKSVLHFTNIVSSKQTSTCRNNHLICRLDPSHDY